MFTTGAVKPENIARKCLERPVTMKEMSQAIGKLLNTKDSHCGKQVVEQLLRYSPPEVVKQVARCILYMRTTTTVLNNANI